MTLLAAATISMCSLHIFYKQKTFLKIIIYPNAYYNICQQYHYLLQYKSMVKQADKCKKYFKKVSIIKCIRLSLKMINDFQKKQPLAEVSFPNSQVNVLYSIWVFVLSRKYTCVILRMCFCYGNSVRKFQIVLFI